MVGDGSLGASLEGGRLGHSSALNDELCLLLFMNSSSSGL